MNPTTTKSVRDPILTSVMANRLDGIVREMSNTMLRAARSHVIAVARDFSCSIVTSDNELLAVAEGLPVHTFGSHLQTIAMYKLHRDLAEGDAFIHNDPYLGNTHAADQTILVPVFFEGEHIFTACAKAHQADIGNGVPTTYAAHARDVYEEGAIIFPCVRVQRNYETVDDIIRMGMARIRVPEQWYGDFLAALGSARIAERRLKEFCLKYGKAAIKDFISSWFDYSENRMIQAIRRFPAATLVNEGKHDPMPPVLPEGIPIKVVVQVDPDAAMIDIDLRDNIDCLDCGLNESEACSLNNVIVGVFNSVESDIPHNAGSFRRIRVHLRDGCVVGRPLFPHSCSVATTNVAARLINVTQGAFAKLGDGYGLAEGTVSLGASMAVVSGRDHRKANKPYVNELFLNLGGGPASPLADGWVNFCLAPAAGLVYRDSVELDEAKYPIDVRSIRLLPGTGGAGRMRGALCSEVVYGPKNGTMTVIIPSDGHHFPPRGVLGGQDSCCGATYKLALDGSETKLANFVQVDLREGEYLRGIECGGGGYGNPIERDPKRVLHDVLEHWETVERARSIYGVVLRASVDGLTLQVDEGATLECRKILKCAGARDQPGP
jgi:N-methylhydantoinase B